jgi:hypothetical protein
MADEAANLYEAQRFEEARDLFHRANELYAAPALMLWEARALDKLGRLVEAEDLCASVQHYRPHPEDTEATLAAVRDATIESERLRKRIPTLQVTLIHFDANDPNVEVRLDDKRLHPALIGFSMPVDPGTRHLRLLVQGRELMFRELSLAEGERVSVDLGPPVPHHSVLGSVLLHPGTVRYGDALVPAPAEQTAKQHWYGSRLSLRPTLGWVSLGVGAAGLATGIVAGVVATQREHDLDRLCPHRQCLPEYRDELSEFRTARTVSTLGYVIGGLGIAGGITLLLVAPRFLGTSQGTATLQVSPNALLLNGVWSTN